MNFFSRIAVLATVVAACWLSFTHAVVICDAPGTVCSNCMIVGTCAAADELPTDAELCRDGKVCQIVGGVGQCVKAAGTPCECEPFTSLCDAHDTLSVAFCYTQEFPPANYVPHIVQTCPVDEPCSDGKCVPITTTPTPTTSTKPATCTAANANKRYPYVGDCKKYYTCREVTRGVYRYVESRCIGSTVFDASKGYCDLTGCP